MADKIKKKTRFDKKVEKAGLTHKCQCWDCVRRVGATPPRFQLNKHGRLYDEHTKDVNPYIENG